MLGRIKLPFPEIRSAILKMDDDLLSENMIKQFLQYIPTKDELELINEYVGGDEEKVSDLGKPEQFYYEVMKTTKYRLMIFVKRCPKLLIMKNGYNPSTIK